MFKELHSLTKTTIRLVIQSLGHSKLDPVLKLMAMQPIRGSGGGGGGGRRRRVRGVVRPVYEDFRPMSEWQQDEASHILVIHLPGFMKEQVKVAAEGRNVIKVHGERLVAGNKWSRFHQEFQVPGDGAMNSLQTKYEGGTLIIKVPKEEAHHGDQTEIPPTPGDEKVEEPTEHHRDQTEISPAPFDEKLEEPTEHHRDQTDEIPPAQVEPDHEKLLHSKTEVVMNDEEKLGVTQNEKCDDDDNKDHAIEKRAVKEKELLLPVEGNKKLGVDERSELVVKFGIGMAIFGWLIAYVACKFACKT